MNSFIFFAFSIDDLMQRLFDIIGGIFNIVWSFLCSIIYGLIVIMFNIFNSITELDFLSTDKVSGIYQRLTMIITIVMVFYITFAVVKYIVSPDTVTDKEKGAGKIVMRIVIAILLIAFIPTIFNIGYELQGRILKTNVISKVIFGQEDWDYKSAGSNFAGDTFAAFYRVNTSNCKTEADCSKAQAKVDSVIQSWKKDQGLWALTKANASEIVDFDNTIQFDGLLAVIFGCFVLYVLFSYNLDMVTRYIQLIFLQLMAPVAVISYIAPQKDNMLKKWAKQCATTYLDLFIRISILYFMLLIVSILSSSFDFYELSKNGQQINIFMYILIIAGLLIFVQRAPKLIKELFPSSEGAASIGFGFNAKDRIEPLKKSINTIKKPIAATAGAVAGVARVFDPTGKLGKNLKTKLASKLTSKLSPSLIGKGNRFLEKTQRGLNKGWSAAKAGYKGAAAGVKNGRFSEATAAARQSVQKDEALVNNGGTVLGHDLRGGHYQDIKAGIKLKIEDLDARIKAKETVSTVAKDTKVMKTLMSYKEDWIQRGIGDPSAREKAMKEIEKATKKYAINGNQGTFESAIKEQLKSVYGSENAIPPEVLGSLITQIGKDEKGVWEKIKVEIEEAKRISTGQGYEPEKDVNGNIVYYDYKGEPITDPNYSGEKHVKYKEIVKENMDLVDFVEKIGDVVDSANLEKALIEKSPETRKANANASEGQK